MKHFSGIVTAALLAAGMLCGCGETIVNDNSDIVEVTGTSATAVTEDTTTTDSRTGTTEAAVTGTDVTTDEPAEKKAAATTAAEESSTSEATTAAPVETDAPAETDAPQEQQQTTEPPADEKKEPYMLDALKLGESCADYVAAHPECRQETAPSCIGKGEDHVYTYADYTLYSYSEDGKETLREIAITGESFETRKGIHVGSTTADVIAAYGEPEEAGFYSYMTEDGRLQIFFDGDRVSKLDFFTNI